MRAYALNKVRVSGDKNRLDSFKCEVKGANGSFDFNRIVPMPDELYEAAVEAAGDGNVPGLDEWLLNNWGSVGLPLKTKAIYADTCMTYLFATVGGVPTKLVEPVVTIAHALGLAVSWEERLEDKRYRPVFTETE